MAGSPPQKLPPGTPGGGHSIERNESLRTLEGPDVDSPEHQQRLKADGELFDRLMWKGFAGGEWEAFRRALTEYALPVLRVWIRRGEVGRQCARYGCPCGEVVASARSDEASQDLAVDTIAYALPYFRDSVLAKGKWNRAGGASLRTYFIGACLFHFRNVYRDWRRLDRRMRVAGPERAEPTFESVVDEHASRNPERSVIATDQLEHLLEGVDNDTCAAVVMDAAGSSYDEIAAELGTTVKSVDARLYRFRSRVR
jgi:DNA-directed RNA polymerase specialized sigma24 family protein